MAPAALVCPNGCGPMRDEIAGPLTLDRCVRCDGRWFDRGELEAWAAARAPASAIRLETFSAATRTGHARCCPRCAAAILFTHDLGWCKAARCDSCRGVFLDREVVDVAMGKVLPFKRSRSGSRTSDLPSIAAEFGGQVLLEILGGIFFP